MHMTQVMVGVHPHVSTCAPLFRVSGTAGRIALKFGVQYEVKSWVGYICTCSCVCLFRVSEMARQTAMNVMSETARHTAMNFGMWLGTY